MARDQALGKLGLVWRRLKPFTATDAAFGRLLPKEPSERRRDSILGAGGQFEAKFIRLADLKGNIPAHPETDETFPRLKSQQRAVLQQLMSIRIRRSRRRCASRPDLGFIKSLIGLSELVVPGEMRATNNCARFRLLLTTGADRIQRPICRKTALPAATLSSSPRFPSTNCSTITPPSSRSAGDGPVGMRDKSARCAKSRGFAHVRADAAERRFGAGAEAGCRSEVGECGRNGTRRRGEGKCFGRHGRK